MRRVVEVSTRGTTIRRDLDGIAVAPPDGEAVHIVPADMNCLILDTEAVTVTGAALGLLCDAGVPVIVCRTHKPAGWLTSLATHERVTARQQDQLDASRPLRKRLWSQIVQAKIKNQALVLDSVAKPDSLARLERLAATVRSGDPDNKEGQAAALYWPELLGRSFRRRPGADPANAGLDYGYTIIRALVARRILGAGLLPSVSLAHKSARDGLALADDLMEPVRPALDRLIAQSTMTTVPPGAHLDSDCRRLLVAKLHDIRMISGGRRVTLSDAVERLVTSLCESYSNGKATLACPVVEC